MAIKNKWTIATMRKLQQCFLKDPSIEKAAMQLGMSESGALWYLMKYNLNPQDAKNWPDK